MRILDTVLTFPSDCEGSLGVLDLDRLALGLELRSASRAADARLRGHAAKILNWPEGWNLCEL
jgi:hypothetical protein